MPSAPSSFTSSIPCLYKGFDPKTTGWQIDIVSADMDPKLFYKNYVALNKPCIINGSCGIRIPSSSSLSTTNRKQSSTSTALSATPSTSATSPLSYWSLDNLVDLAGHADVFIEHRDEITRTFGTGIKKPMKFQKFIEAMSNQQSNLYLTTQPLDWEDDEDETENKITTASKRKQSSTDNIKKSSTVSPPIDKAPWKLYASPLKYLSSLFSLRPSLLGNLVPSSINLWIGSSTEGSSSNLHHDFHANLYTLIQGRKTFTISSPTNASYLYTHGRITLIHPNGLINYAGYPTRADGVPLSLEDEELNDDDDDAIEKAFLVDDEDENVRSKTKTKKDSKGKGTTTKDDDDADAMWAALLSTSSAKSSSKTTKASGKKRTLDEAIPSTSSKTEEKETKSSTKKNKVASSSLTKDAAKASSSSVSKIPDHFSQIPLPELRSQALKEITRSSTSSSSASVANGKELLQTIQQLPIVSQQFPLFTKAILTQFTLEAGQSLYLPPGWFHEVVSHGTSVSAGTTPRTSDGHENKSTKNKENTTKSSGSPTSHIHIALNHWFAPPTKNNYVNPYEDTYWEEKFMNSL